MVKGVDSETGSAFKFKWKIYISSNKSIIGDPQPVTNTDWKFTPLGIVSFPPQRAILDENFALRLSQLTVDFYAEIIDDTNSPILKVDCFALLPYAHNGIIDGIHLSELDSRFSKLSIYTNENNEIIIHAESTDFLSIDESALAELFEWYIPRKDMLVVAFVERAASHVITDSFTITLKYLPEYRNKNTDT